MMFKNLRIYACSHGKFGSTNQTPHEWFDENSFGWFMASSLKLNLINKSRPGASNYEIFQIIYDDLESITNDDLILVQWSHVCRAWSHDGVIMPHTARKVAKIYYKNLYNEIQETNKVLGYTLLLENCIKNFYFNFADGSNYFEEISNNTFSMFNTKKNYLKVNDRHISNCFYPNLEDGFHLNKQSLELLSKKYIDILSTISYS
jgi:hypothetical protein